MAQVIEGEILDHCPLVPAALRLERAEPIIDAFFGQALTALGGKHIGPLGVTPGLQVGIERLAGLVQQIDIPPLAPIMAHMQPAHLGTHMGVGYLEPGDLAHPAARPVAQGEEGRSPRIVGLLDQRVQDRALLSRELLRSQQRERGQIDATGGVALQQFLLLNEEVGKVADGGFDACPVMQTQAFLL